VSARRRRTPRDARRRSLGQNFLADERAVGKLIRAVQIEPDQLILEPGAGSGALTIPLAQAGAQVIAVESDPVWVKRLTDTVIRVGLQDRIKVVRGDFRSIRLPIDPYRVVANPPFGVTTALLSRLFDDPTRGPWRADLLVQREVATKRAATPPSSLRTAAWAPWWTFELGPVIPRTAFRPVPKVDAALLTVRRRDPAVLPEWLAPGLRDLLRPGWDPPAQRKQNLGRGKR